MTNKNAMKKKRKIKVMLSSYAKEKENGKKKNESLWKETKKAV